MNLGDDMKMKMYVNNDKIIAGMTLKNTTELEQGNMALHICVNPEDILENRKKLATSLSSEMDNFVCANQTHSANFHRVTIEDKGRGARTKDTAIPDTDALYTFESNIILTSFSADCVPVIFYNKVNGLIGVIHSGWQGTIKEVTLKLFRHLKKVENCNPSDFHVQIGAALSQEKFEVDLDVYKKFNNLGYAKDFIYFKSSTNKYHIDNQLTVKKQCELAGIPTDHITIDPTCTFISPDGFSYREDRQSGRHLSFIMKKD